MDDFERKQHTDFLKALSEEQSLSKQEEYAIIDMIATECGKTFNSGNKKTISERQRAEMAAEIEQKYGKEALEAIKQEIKQSRP